MTCVCIHDGDRHVGSVCRPSTFWVRAVRRCPECDQVRRLVGFDQVWFGITWTCAGCGVSFTAEEFLPKPWERGWRAKAIAAARERWPQSRKAGGPEHRQWLHGQLAAEAAS